MADSGQDYGLRTDQMRDRIVRRLDEYFEPSEDGYSTFGDELRSLIDELLETVRHEMRCTCQPDLLPVEHRSLQPSRLRKRARPIEDYVNPERIYLAEWMRWCRDQNTAEAVCMPLRGRMDHMVAPPPISRRDAAVMASLIQWLATNVGHGFLHQCERKVADERARLRGRVRRRRMLHEANVLREQRARERAEAQREPVRAIAIGRDTMGGAL